MKTKLVIGLIIAALLIAGLPGVAAAAPVEQTRQVGAAVGEVTAINGNTLDIQSWRGQAVKVQTDAQTRFRVRGVQNPSIDDIKVGDVVAARGQRTNDVLHAKAVTVVPANLRHQVTGKVTAITGSTLALIDQDGQPVNVATTALTVYRNPDKPDATFADIQLGDVVTGVGVRQDDTLTALVVRFKTPPQRNPGPIAAGEISAIAGDTLTLKQPFGETLTVTTNASTFVVLRGENGPTVGSLSDLQVGDKLMVVGPRSSDNSQLEARAIVVGQKP